MPLGLGPIAGRALASLVAASGGSPPAGVDPATLSLTIWLHGDYAGSPWVGTASLGPSGARSIGQATPPGVGATLNGHPSADCNGSTQSLDSTAGTGDLLGGDVFGTAGSGWCLIQADSAAADPGAGNYYTSPALWSDDGVTYAQVVFSTAGVVFATIDPSAAYVETTPIACSTGTPHLVQWKWDGVDLFLRVDAGSWTSAPSGGISATGLANALAVGRGFGGNFDGRVWDFALADSVISDADFDGVGSFLQTFYGISLGFSASAVVGTLSATLGAITLSSAGAAPAKGTLSATLGAVALSSAGAGPAKGTLASTIAAVTISAAGAAPAVGTLTGTIGAVTLSVTTATPAAGTLSATVGAVTCSSAAASPVVGTCSATVGAVTLASAGASPVVGTLSAAIGAITLTVATSTPAKGTLAATLGAITLSSAGAGPVVATDSSTIGAVTLSSSAVSPIVGTLGVSIGNITLQALDGAPPIVGTLSATVGAVTISSSAAAPAVGTLSATLGAVTISAAGKAPALGTLAKTLGAVTIASAAAAPAKGTLAATLGPVTMTAATTSPVVGTESSTIGAVTLVALASAPAAATLSATIGAVTLEAHGTDGVAVDPVWFDLVVRGCVSVEPVIEPGGATWAGEVRGAVSVLTYVTACENVTDEVEASDDIAPRVKGCVAVEPVPALAA